MKKYMADVTWADLMNVFYTKPIHYGWVKQAPQATTIATGISRAVESIIQGGTHVVGNYIADPLKNIWSAVYDVWQWVSGLVLESQRGSNNRMTHLWLGLSGAVTNTVRAVSNATLWTLSAVDYMYRSLVDAHSELSSGTFDRLGKPGMTFGNLRRVALGTVWWIPWLANEVAKTIQKPLDFLHHRTRLSGRESYVAELPFR